MHVGLSDWLVVSRIHLVIMWHHPLECHFFLTAEEPPTSPQPNHGLGVDTTHMSNLNMKSPSLHQEGRALRPGRAMGWVGSAERCGGRLVVVVTNDWGRRAERLSPRVDMPSMAALEEQRSDSMALDARQNCCCHPQMQQTHENGPWGERERQRILMDLGSDPTVTNKCVTCQVTLGNNRDKTECSRNAGEQ
jgi:hypothetical protein